MNEQITELQGNALKGEPQSVLRARTAIDNSLLICRRCLDSIEFATVVGPFTTEAVKVAKTPKTHCYICEVWLIGKSFMVKRP